jgi:hypothetical protein
MSRHSASWEHACFGQLSPRRQLEQHLESLPLHMQRRMETLVGGIATTLEGTCSTAVIMADQGISPGWARDFPERHALVAYAPDIRPTVVVGLSDRTCADLQIAGTQLAARMSSVQINPMRGLLQAVHSALGSTIVGVLDLQLIYKLLAMTLVLVPTGFEGRLPLAWTVALGDGNLIAPILLPPTLQEIETDSWECRP